MNTFRIFRINAELVESQVQSIHCQLKLVHVSSAQGMLQDTDGIFHLLPFIALETVSGAPCPGKHGLGTVLLGRLFLFPAFSGGIGLRVTHGLMNFRLTHPACAGYGDLLGVPCSLVTPFPSISPTP